MNKILKVDIDVSNAQYFASIDDLKRANEAIETVAIIVSYNNNLIADLLDELG